MKELARNNPRFDSIRPLWEAVESAKDAYEAAYSRGDDRETLDALLRDHRSAYDTYQAHPDCSAFQDAVFVLPKSEKMFFLDLDDEELCCLGIGYTPDPFFGVVGWWCEWQGLSKEDERRGFSTRDEALVEALAVARSYWPNLREATPEDIRRYGRIQLEDGVMDDLGSVVPAKQRASAD